MTRGYQQLGSLFLAACVGFGAFYQSHSHAAAWTLPYLSLVDGSPDMGQRVTMTCNTAVKGQSSPPDGVCEALEKELPKNTALKIVDPSQFFSSSDTADLLLKLTITRDQPTFIEGFLSWIECAEGKCSEMSQGPLIQLSQDDASILPKRYALFARALLKETDLPI